MIKRLNHVFLFCTSLFITAWPGWASENVTDGAVRLIKRFERFSSTVYFDSEGKPTIGYGHLITANEREEFEGKEWNEDEALDSVVMK